MNKTQRLYWLECLDDAVRLMKNLPAEVEDLYIFADEETTMNDIGEQAEFDFMEHLHEAHHAPVIDNMQDAIDCLEQIPRRHHEADTSQWIERSPNANGVMLIDLPETIVAMSTSTYENMTQHFMGEIHEYILRNKPGNRLDALIFESLIDRYRDEYIRFHDDND